MLRRNAVVDDMERLETSRNVSREFRAATARNLSQNEVVVGGMDTQTRIAATIIDRLPSTLLIPFELHHGCRKTKAEVAELLHTTPRTIEIVLAEALEHVQAGASGAATVVRIRDACAQRVNVRGGEVRYQRARQGLARMLLNVTAPTAPQVDATAKVLAARLDVQHAQVLRAIGEFRDAGALGQSRPLRVLDRARLAAVVATEPVADGVALIVHPRGADEILVPAWKATSAEEVDTILSSHASLEAAWFIREHGDTELVGGYLPGDLVDRAEVREKVIDDAGQDVGRPLYTQEVQRLGELFRRRLSYDTGAEAT